MNVEFEGRLENIKAGSMLFIKGVKYTVVKRYYMSKLDVTKLWLRRGP